MRALSSLVTMKLLSLLPVVCVAIGVASVAVAMADDEVTYSCIECDLGDYCDNPIINGICECDKFTNEDAWRAYYTLAAAVITSDLELQVVIKVYFRWK